MREESYKVGCNPVMTKGEFERLRKKMEQDKKEYEAVTGKSLSEERKRLAGRLPRK